MRPLILVFQEKSRSLNLCSGLGTKTITEARENQDNDFDEVGFTSDRKTYTASRENMDDRQFWS